MKKNSVEKKLMRAAFAHEVHKQMKKNKNIWVVVGDFGYKMWDQVKQDFSDRFINVGAAEQAMIGISVGLALEGKIPIVYTATTFLLYRPFETIRNYINYEKIPVRLVGSGRERNYAHDGISHWVEEDREVMKIFSNINSVWPESVDEIPYLVKRIVNTNKPWYINLKR
ncbi:MAG TPA: hypothetical protein VF189_02670 [Patescibacteria group bacterium]